MKKEYFMPKRFFDEKEVETLNRNKYVVKASSKLIIYSDEFKDIFIRKSNAGKLHKAIFEEAGFDIEMVGIERVKTASRRWKKAYNENGIIGLINKSKIPSTKEKSEVSEQEERIKKLEAQIKYLKVENEFLKKLTEIKRGDA
jgi:hypothetical protein